MKRFLLCVCALFLVGAGGLTYRHWRWKQRFLLEGGTIFVVQVKPALDAEGRPQPVTRSSVENAMGNLERRLGGSNTVRAVMPVGEDRIEVQVAAGSEGYLAMRDDIEQRGKLEFRLVHSRGDTLGYVKLPLHPPEAGEERELLVKNHADLDGHYVKQAFATLDPNKGWEIILKFDSEGAKLFGALTAARLQERLAVVVDGVIISAPTLDEAVTAGFIEVRGKFTETSARGLASALETPLENPLVIVSVETLSVEAGKAAP